MIFSDRKPWQDNGFRAMFCNPLFNSYGAYGFVKVVKVCAVKCLVKFTFAKVNIAFFAKTVC